MGPLKNSANKKVVISTVYMYFNHYVLIEIRVVGRGGVALGKQDKRVMGYFKIHIKEFKNFQCFYMAVML